MSHNISTRSAAAARVVIRGMKPAAAPTRRRRVQHPTSGPGRIVHVAEADRLVVRSFHPRVDAQRLAVLAARADADVVRRIARVDWIGRTRQTYPSVAAAAREFDVYPNAIWTAEKRGGWCAGWRWEWKWVRGGKIVRNPVAGPQLGV
jgi:hypothetical protein